MKIKNSVLLSMIVLSGITFTSCGNKNNAMVGIGYAASFDGKEEADVTSAMVAFDKSGTILAARIDVLEMKVSIDGEKIKVNSATQNGDIKSNLELGKEYNMSNSGPNMDVQIEAFSQWSVGKSISEIKSYTQSNQQGVYLKEGTLQNFTIKVGSFIQALESAYDLKSTAKYSIADSKTGIAFTTSVGKNEITVGLCGAMVKDQKAVAVAIDDVIFPFTIQNNTIALNTSSKYYDTKMTIKSKKVLGDDYAMAAKNGGVSALEWYEQAEIIEKGAIGLNIQEIKSLQSAKEPIASATIGVDSYVKGIAKAIEYATKNPIGSQA